MSRTEDSMEPRIAGSAGVLAAGNVASRLLGLLRSQMIANQWGTSLEASAFQAAARVPTLLYDLLVGGMLTAALVPVLAAYRATDRAELWRAAAALVTGMALVAGVVASAVFALAPAIAPFLGRGYGPEGIALIETALRIMAPAILLFGLAGMVTGVLYALERFSVPAATGAIYNAAFILAALALQPRLGSLALAAGVAAGALAQLAVLVPTAARLGLVLRWDPRHPALAKVLVLYLPIGAGLVVSLVQGSAEPGIASFWGAQSLARMELATHLIQLPHGLIAMALSFAILPRLAAAHARQDPDAFGDTLARGLRAVVVLTLPAAAGLAVLAEPVIGALFQHGAFQGADRIAVSYALYGYLVGLPFAAIDWPLNYAFYARHNAAVPAAVGAAAVGLWFVAAYRLPPLVADMAGAEWGFLGLALADSAKHAAHAAVMLVLVYRVAGQGALAGLPGAFAKGLVATGIMAASVLASDRFVAGLVTEGNLGWAIRAALGVVVGGAVYALSAWRLGIAEIPWLAREVSRRLGVAGS